MRRIVFLFFIFFTTTIWAQLEFGSIENLSNTPGWVSEEPDIAIDGENLYLVWNKWGDIAFKKSNDMGNSWSNTQILYSVLDYGAYYPAIAQSNQNVYIFYHRNAVNNSEIFMCRSSNNGDSFENEVQVTNAIHGAQTCQVAASGDNIYLVYEDRDADYTYQLYMVKSTDNGENWSEPIQISDPQYHSRWVNLVYANSTLYCTWNAQVGGNYDQLDLYFAKSEDNGDSWSDPFNISNDQAYNARLDTAVLDNKIYIAVSAKPDGLQSDIILYKSENNGESWIKLGNISDNSGSSSRPNLWITQNPNSSQTLYVAWSDDTYAVDSQIYLKYSLNNGSSWSEKFLVSNETGDSGWPHIVGNSVNENDDMYCVWHYAEAGTFDYEIYGRSATYSYEPMATLWGTVQNESEDPLEDALITANTYSTHSNEEGMYELTLTAGTHEVHCSASGYVTISEEIEIEADENMELNFTLSSQPEILFPPVNLTAEIVEDDILLEWQEPQSNGNYLHWDNNQNSDSVGGPSIETFDCAVRFTQSDISEYEGDYLTKIRFYIADNNCELFLRVWQGGSQYFAGNLVLEQEVQELTSNSWNLFQLDYPIQIDSSQELWFGYRINNPNGVYPAGSDNGPAVPFQGDMLLYGSNWVSMYDYFGWDINWNIQGFVVSTDPDKKTNILSKNGNKQLLGYNIYQNDQLIVENFNEQTSYLVTDLEPEETYEFYVTALYSSGESSASNIAEITLTANENESVPTTFSLHGNYPNPFNPSTTIYFQIGKTENVNLEIFNTKGQKIKSYHVSKGQQQITWNGCDSNGKLVDSGIYFYRLSAQNKNIIRKMLLLK